VSAFELSNILLDWYRQNARSLPWRISKDAYAIWVAEIMLQQTRVDTVLRYYPVWMLKFPNIATLAEAGLDQVLKTWEGLGYYSRARNLYRAAKQVVEEMNGELPKEVKQLRRLPGIGRYTAAAIASIAFGLDEPTLDGNIRRVLARVFDVGLPARSSEGEKLLWNLAREHLPADYAGDYNQAMMDLGAMICTPGTPDCQKCPLNQICHTHATGNETARPVLQRKPAIPHLTVTAAVICKGNCVLIAQRPLNGLLGGMWEFPGGKVEQGEELESCLKREIREELGITIDVANQLGTYKHAYTHFRVTLYAFECSLHNGSIPHPFHAIDFRWVKLNELDHFPMGKIDRLISKELIQRVNPC